MLPPVPNKLLLPLIDEARSRPMPHAPHRPTLIAPTLAPTLSPPLSPTLTQPITRLPIPRCTLLRCGKAGIAAKAAGRVELLSNEIGEGEAAGVMVLSPGPGEYVVSTW